MAEAQPISTEAHQKATKEVRKEPLTDSQIAVQIFNGLEAYLKASRRVSSSAIEQSFSPYQPGRLDFTISYSDGKFADATLVKERDDSGKIERILAFEFWPAYEGDSYDRLDVSVMGNVSEQETGTISSVNDQQEESKIARGIAERLLTNINNGSLELFEEQPPLKDETYRRDTQSFNPLFMEEDTPERETNIQSLKGEIFVAEQKLDTEKSRRAAKARARIARFSSEAFDLGVGEGYKGFDERFGTVFYRAIEVKLFDHLETPIRAINGSWLTQVDAFLLNDGLHLYRSGKDGVDWSQKLEPTDDQVLLLEEPALSKLHDSLLRILPSTRELNRKLAERTRVTSS